MAFSDCQYGFVGGLVPLCCEYKMASFTELDNLLNATNFA